MILEKSEFKNGFSFFSVKHVVSTLWNCLIKAISTCTDNMCQIGFEIVHHKLSFQKLLNNFFNQHVEKNKFSCTVKLV